MILTLERIMRVLNVPLLIFIALLFTRFQVIFTDKDEKRRSSFAAILVIAVLISLSYGSFSGGFVSYVLITELLAVILMGLFHTGFLDTHFLLGKWAMYLLIIKNVLYCLASVFTDRSIAALRASPGIRQNISFFVYLFGVAAFLLLQRIYPRARVRKLLNNRNAVKILVLIEYGFSFVCVIFLEYLLTDVSYEREYLYHILTLLIGGGLYSAVFYMFVFFQERDEEKERAEKLELLHKRSREYYEQELQGMQELRRARHDYRNQLFIIRCLLEEGDIGKAREYVAGQEEQTQRVDSGTLCNWKILNYILAREKTYLEERGVRCQIALWIPDIQVKEEDLYLVFLNLLHNCREALLRQDGAEERYLEIWGEEEPAETGEGSERFAIYLENSFSGEILLNGRKEIMSVKDDKVNHGLGLKIVRSILEQNGGTAEYRFDREEKYFLVKLTLEEGAGNGS